jgi:hypothetical protein
MVSDPTAEIKRIRHELGAEDDFDIAKIFARLRRKETESGRTYVRRPPRKTSETNKRLTSPVRHKEVDQRENSL